MQRAFDEIQQALAEGKSLSDLGIHIPGEESQSETNTSTSSVAPPPEIVYKVRGSTAGVGSEYFDNYRRQRRKETYRIYQLQKESELVCSLNIYNHSTLF